MVNDGLRLSVEMLSALVEDSPEAVVVYSVAETGYRLQMANRAARKSSGLGPRQYGLLLEEIYPEEETRSLSYYFSQAVQRGTPLVVGQALFPGETGGAGELSLLPIKGSRGTVEFLLVKTFHPNQNHQPAQAVLENMLDCIPDAVLSSDRKGIITYCNEAFEVMFGYSRAELIGLDRRNLPILPAFDKDAQSSIYTRLAAGEAIYNYETVRLTRGGIPLDVSISMTPIREQGKEITGLTSVYKDITEHKRTQNAIQESEARYKLITSNMTEMIALLDNERRYLFVSPSYESKLGYRPEELLGQCADRFVYSEDALRFRKKLAETDTGMSHSVEYRHLKADGRLLWVELRLSVLASGGLNRYLAVGRDISERKQLEEQMIHMSYYDTVTGAPNLYLFKDRLNEAVRTARRFYHGLALFYVSLDGFRKINTAYGYEAGNAVLKAVAERLMSGIREKGTVGRISGDEFTVYLHGIERKQDAVRIAERIADQLAEPFDLQGKAVPLTASIGIAVYPDDCLDSVALIDHAHAAMFRAKENGKGRWHLYDSD